jgi:serine/threonine protein kinase/Tfp pilus assembly protein PilF
LRLENRRSQGTEYPATNRIDQKELFRSVFMQNAVPVRVQLGAFELDMKAGELRKNDCKIRLQEQPFQILLMLIERSGQVVTLDEIKKKLWPNDTVVEFDHSIHTAIKKLRQALDDSADNPRYVETVARRGYRLMVPVECLESTPGDVSPGDAASSGGALQTEATPALIGKKVSHYRVLEVIGGGGMGMVYKAEDLKLGRRVALKFLPEEMATDSVALQRFEREARTASSLSHFNICTIHEFGEHEGQPFLVMELLEGETLRELISRAGASSGGDGSQLSLERVLDIASQITDGLDAAHQRGIIHRDIKPANIFLTTQGRVKILDFGLAKLAAAASEVEAEDPRRDQAHGLPAQTTGGTPIEHTLTRTGMAMGTAGYMSPEQVRGEQLDERTDLFSFGLVLFEMATGQRAFSGETAAILKHAILNTTPVPVHELNSTLPPKLEQIINKLLEKDRELRYQSAGEMRLDLKAVKPEAKSDGSQVSIRRRWKLLVAATVIVLALIAGTRYWQQPLKTIQLKRNDTFVLASFTNTTGSPVFDSALGGALYNNLEQSPFFNELNYSKVASTLQLMKRAPSEQLTIDLARQVCVRTNSKAVIAGSIADAGNRYRIGLRAVECQTGSTMANIEAEAEGQDEVIRTLGQAGTRLRLELGEPPASVQKFNRPLEEALTSSMEALKAFSMGVFTTGGDAEAVPHFKRAVELDPNFATAHWWLALAYASLNQTSLANQSYATAFKLRDRLNERDRLSFEATYYMVVTGELEKGTQVLEKTIRTYPEHNYDHEELGRVYGELGRYREEAAEQSMSLQIDPYVAFPAAELINAYIALDQLEHAQSVFQEARGRGLDDPQLRFSRYSLAFMQHDKAGMEEQLAWGTGKPKIEDVLFSQHSDTEAYYGRLASARRFADRAVGSAQRAGAAETSAGWRVDQALREAEVGNVDGARQMAFESLSMSRTRDVKVGAALVLARVGNTMTAGRLADEINEEYPLNTLLQKYSLPTIRATIALQLNDPARSIEILRQTEPYELTGYGLGDLYPDYVRGQAYLKLGKGQQAAAEFQKMIDHPGIVLNFVTGALTRLQLGRAQAMSGDMAAARKSYQDFLALWKHADADVPIYRQAKLEYAKLR